MPSIADEYLVGRTRGGTASRRAAAGLHWSRMIEDLQEEILQHASIAVVEQVFRLRYAPADLADMAAYPFLFKASQEYVFSRARESLFEWGRLLTITFSDSVDRTDRKLLDSKIDVDRLCARMDYKQTWSGISKIRLRLELRPQDYGVRFYLFEFVRRGHDGGDEVVAAPPELFVLMGSKQKRLFAFRLVKELKLRHAVVDGVDEFSC
jgi:hypothetical protein